MSDKPSAVSLRLADIAIEAIGHDPKLAGWVLARLRVARALDEGGVAKTEKELKAAIACEADYTSCDSPAETIGMMRDMARHALAALRGDKT